MSVNKLLKRIVAPELSLEEMENLQQVDDMAAHLHDYTHGSKFLLVHGISSQLPLSFFDANLTKPPLLRTLRCFFSQWRPLALVCNHDIGSYP